MAMRVEHIEVIPVVAGAPEVAEAARIYSDVWNREWESSHEFIARYATYRTSRGASPW